MKCFREIHALKVEVIISRHNSLWYLIAMQKSYQRSSWWAESCMYLLCQRLKCIYITWDVEPWFRDKLCVTRDWDIPLYYKLIKSQRCTETMPMQKKFFSVFVQKVVLLAMELLNFNRLLKDIGNVDSVLYICIWWLCMNVRTTG